MTNVLLLDLQNVVASTKIFMVDSEMQSRMNGHRAVSFYINVLHAMP